MSALCQFCDGGVLTLTEHARPHETLHASKVEDYRCLGCERTYRRVFKEKLMNGKTRFIEFWGVKHAPGDAAFSDMPEDKQPRWPERG